MIIDIIALALFIVFLYLIFGKRTNKSSSASAAGASSISPQNQSMQQEYLAKKATEQDKLTFQEKVDKSWEFLTRITQAIIDRFSIEEQLEVEDAGKKMAQNGTLYHHNVENEVKRDHSFQEALANKKLNNESKSI